MLSIVDGRTRLPLFCGAGGIDGDTDDRTADAVVGGAPVGLGWFLTRWVAVANAGHKSWPHGDCKRDDFL